MSVIPADTTTSFIINLVGETTGLPLAGEFRSKVRLTHREQLVQDEYRRRLLGSDPANASQPAATKAHVFSVLYSHVVKAPQWWTTADHGLDLEDENVVYEVYEKVANGILEFRKSLEKDTKDLKTDLSEKQSKIREEAAQ